MIHEAQSLKAKRKVLRSLVDRLASRFECAVSEVGDQDLWQSAVIGVAIVSLDAPGADSRLRKIEEFIEQHPGSSVVEIDRVVEQYD
ncbi:MAG: DUF503 domain-containing protein [Cyanothece sp. SIO1E1]|nr:DUF503 domain-containing protein [Cyanothece sp. SIO1E1]